MPSCWKPSWPTTPTATSGATADELPDDLLREATQRLGILALVWAGLFAIGILMNDLVAPLMNIPMRDLIPWGRPADIVGVLSISLSLWLWRYTRRLTCRPRLALDLALGYEVLLAFGIGDRQPVGAAPAPGRPALVDLRAGAALPDDRPQHAAEDAHRLTDRGLDGSPRAAGGAPPGARDARPSR